MNRILITGSQGFVGSNLWFSKDEETVGIDLKNGDNILDCELPHVNIIIHLAAQTDVTASVANPFYCANNNVMGTIRLAEQYRHSRFIFASSGGAIQNESTESPYGASKLAAELFIKNICSNYVILRFPNIYGQGSKSVVDKFMFQKQLTIYGDGMATRNYVHVSDIAEAIRLARTWKPGTYSLGSGLNYNVETIAKMTGKPITYAPARPGEIDRSYVDNTTPNWTPKVKLLDYIRENNR